MPFIKYTWKVIKQQAYSLNLYLILIKQYASFMCYYMIPPVEIENRY